MEESDVPTFYESLTNRARTLRANPTEAEQHLWRYLRYERLGVKFRRQARIASYICDFVCFEKKLIIELDGGHHQQEQQHQHDHVRTQWLRTQGFRVIRFWNHEVLKNTDAVLSVIQKILWTSPLVGEVGPPEADRVGDFTSGKEHFNSRNGEIQKKGKSPIRPADGGPPSPTSGEGKDEK